MTYEKSLDRVRSTGLAKLARSPAHFKAWVQEPMQDTPAMALGRALHCAVLEPDAFAQRYTVEPEWGDCRKTENKQRRDEWRLEHADRELVTADDWRSVCGMGEALRAHPLMRKLLDAINFREYMLDAKSIDHPQLTLTAQFDLLVPSLGLAVDIKSCEDASPAACSRSIGRYGYLLQDVHYTHVAELTGMLLRGFVFAFVEKAEPYATQLVVVDADDKGRIRERYDRLLDLHERCVATDTWPAYGDHIHTVKLPKWAWEGE